MFCEKSYTWASPAATTAGTMSPPMSCLLAVRAASSVTKVRSRSASNR